MINQDILWVSKYRPKCVEECILPEQIKKTLIGYRETGTVPNLLISGSAGIGKTSSIIALVQELGMDYIMINGSNENGVDVLRTKITNYASSVSLTGGRKVVIIDEADYLTPQAQAIFRGVIEEFAGNCSFVFTCNYKNRLIDPLHSRCAVIDYKLPADEKPLLAQVFMKRVETILKEEGVEYDRKVVIELVKKHFPDFRRVLGELQRYSVSGKIDVGILAATANTNITELIGYLKQKDFRAMRTWVGQNAGNDDQKIMREIYDNINEIVKPECGPILVVLAGKYMYQSAFCQDKEVNLAAFLTEILLECEMK